jgi:sigma-B regulation protein RsbU (phosphoserine phosphatase)
MWNIDSTIRLLQQMSQSTDPGELVRLFFEHVWRSVDVQRALVLNRAGLSSPQCRLVHDVTCHDETSSSVPTLNEIREGGLLASILYGGQFQNLAPFEPDPTDPAFDLLGKARSLMAFPLFEKGESIGMVVILGDSPRSPDMADLCSLGMVSALLGRAIESQKLASQFEVTYQSLDSELKAAADVQRWLLPSLPRLHNASIAASYRTARYSGGDYYDVGQLPGGRIGILIADVSGKGAPAAVLMAVLRSIVHEEMDRAEPSGPAALLDYADRRLAAMGLPQRGAFVTAFCCTFNMESGELVYACAGHCPPRLLRMKDRTVISLDRAKTWPLGLVDEPSTHTQETVQLAPGDMVLFYTDGVTEARSPAGEFFDIDRVDHILRDLPRTAGPEAAVQAITRAIARFAGDVTPADDQTVLALSRLARKSLSISRAT